MKCDNCWHPIWMRFSSAIYWQHENTAKISMVTNRKIKLFENVYQFLNWQWASATKCFFLFVWSIRFKWDQFIHFRSVRIRKGSTTVADIAASNYYLPFKCQCDRVPSLQNIYTQLCSGTIGCANETSFQRTLNRNSHSSNVLILFSFICPNSIKQCTFDNFQ